MRSAAQFAQPVIMVALAMGLALAAVAEWTAERSTHVATVIARGEATTMADLSPQQAIALVGQILEEADRRWPVRREAAFERARLAAETEHDAASAARWLARCEGHLHSPLRWNQLAANVHLALGDRAGAREALSRSLALKPGSPSSHWRGLVDLSQALNASREAVIAAQIRARMWAAPEAP